MTRYTICLVIYLSIYICIHVSTSRSPLNIRSGGFYDPEAGRVLVNGVDMKSFKIAALRRCIGYVGQEPVLFASSIRHNIMQGCPTASKEDFSKVGSSLKQVESR